MDLLNGFQPVETVYTTFSWIVKKLLTPGAAFSEVFFMILRLEYRETF